MRPRQFPIRGKLKSGKSITAIVAGCGLALSVVLFSQAVMTTGSRSGPGELAQSTSAVGQFSGELPAAGDSHAATIEELADTRSASPTTDRRLKRFPAIENDSADIGSVSQLDTSFVAGKIKFTNFNEEGEQTHSDVQNGNAYLPPNMIKFAQPIPYAEREPGIADVDAPRSAIRSSRRQYAQNFQEEKPADEQGEMSRVAENANDQARNDDSHEPLIPLKFHPIRDFLKLAMTPRGQSPQDQAPRDQAPNRGNATPTITRFPTFENAGNQAADVNAPAGQPSQSVLANNHHEQPRQPTLDQTEHAMPPLDLTSEFGHWNSVVNREHQTHQPWSGDAPVGPAPSMTFPPESITEQTGILNGNHHTNPIVNHYANPNVNHAANPNVNHHTNPIFSNPTNPIVNHHANLPGAPPGTNHFENHNANQLANQLANRDSNDASHSVIVRHPSRDESNPPAQTPAFEFPWPPNDTRPHISVLKSVNRIAMEPTPSRADYAPSYALKNAQSRDSADSPTSQREATSETEQPSVASSPPTHQAPASVLVNKSRPQTNGPSQDQTTTLAQQNGGTDTVNSPPAANDDAAPNTLALSQTAADPPPSMPEPIGQGNPSDPSRTTGGGIRGAANPPECEVIRPMYTIDSIQVANLGAAEKKIYEQYDFAKDKFGRADERIDSRGRFDVAQTNYVLYGKSAQFCFHPLHFEQFNLERYGRRVPYVQPLISGAHFYTSVGLWPARAIIHPPWQRACTNPNYPAPGSDATAQLNQPPMAY